MSSGIYGIHGYRAIMTLTIMGLLVTASTAIAAGVTKPPKLTYAVSWIGNSFPGKGSNGSGSWVQDFVEGVAVTPGGTVVAVSPWDEAGRCIGLYKDGKVNTRLLQQTGGTGEKAWGWGTGSKAVAVDGESIFLCSTTKQLMRFGWQPEKIDTPKFELSADLAEGHKEKDDECRTMAAGDGLLWLAWSKGGLEIRNQKDFSLVASVKGEPIGKLAFDPRGCLWAIRNKAVIRLSKDGREQGPTIVDAGIPSAVSVDPKGRLIVCDDGPRQQVRFYDPTPTVPVLTGTFGARGGIGSGNPGAVSPEKLFALRGAGCDAEGNLYVCMGVGETVIRKYAPDSTVPVWELQNRHFVDCAAFDPASDGTRIYGVEEIYDVDYSKDMGNEATVTDMTRDQSANPTDPRMKRDVVCNVWYRSTGGSRLLFVNGMYTQNSTGKTGFDIYGFQPGKGGVAKFLSSFSGDGWAWDIDSKGDIWEGAGSGNLIRHYGYKGLGADGLPIFEARKDARSFKRPSEFTKIERIHYVPETDTMYLSGYTKDLPEKDWGLVGSTLIRYDGWISGNRKLSYQVVLPKDSGGLMPKAFDMAGDYVFVVSCRDAEVYVYKASDGSLVGSMKPNATVGFNTGWVDIPYGIRAVKRSDGEYVILVEEDWRGKNLMYRWRP